MDGELPPRKVTEYIGRWPAFITTAASAVFSNTRRNWIRITLLFTPIVLTTRNLKQIVKKMATW